MCERVPKNINTDTTYTGVLVHTDWVSVFDDNLTSLMFSFTFSLPRLVSDSAVRSSRRAGLGSLVLSVRFRCCSILFQRTRVFGLFLCTTCTINAGYFARV